MKKLMLDSGAYSAYRKGKVIDIDAYIAFIKEFGHLFDVCVNLDVIGDGEASYMNWMYMKRQGVNTMPVYHIGTHIKWLKKYLRKTDYIGLGAIANLSSVRRIKSLSEIWEKYLVDPKTKLATHKVHGMGLTAIDIIERYPWYSVDSISPVLVAAFGGVYLPRIEKNKFNFLKLDAYKISRQNKNHVSGVTLSFMNIGLTSQVKYLKYFKKYNIPFDGVSPYSKGTWMFGGRTEKQEGEEITLATDYITRFILNLRTWWGMNQLIPNMQRPLGGKLSDYDGERLLLYVGSASHFKYVAAEEGDISQLFSYVELSTEKDVNTKILKYLKDGDN